MFCAGRNRRERLDREVRARERCHAAPSGRSGGSYAHRQPRHWPAKPGRTSVREVCQTARPPATTPIIAALPPIGHDCRGRVDQSRNAVA
jgi:hypothetical protein